MSRYHDNLPGPSLAQYFEAPDDYLGHFGWVCGYSADAPFLNDAAERFTRLTSAQRAHVGRIALGVILDPGNLPITMLDVPGVAHLPILDVVKKPFRLLHCKIALLGFRHAESGARWRLRLIVSTANWTRQTLEESLDLAWCTEVSSEALVEPSNKTSQACVDIKAAHGLLKWLGNYFDTRLLSAGPLGSFNETEHAREQFERWIGSCSQTAKGQAQFFDNRKEALLRQLPGHVASRGNGVARNYLAMGSGFYEAATDKNRLPEVPGSIISALKSKSLLTKTPEVDLFVNPQACQAIATSASALIEQGITIRPAAKPASVFGAGKPRALHAKFLFSANYRETSGACSSAWVYLGSGNLTAAGFSRRMSPSAGNLEAGVVFEPEALYWQKGREIDEWQVVTNLLPIQWSEHFDDRLNQLLPGSEMIPRESSYAAAPVAWLNWWVGADSNELRIPASVPDDFVVLDPAGQACSRSETGISWPAPQPRQVRCRWRLGGNYYESELPVVDEFGRIAASQLMAIGLDEAFWQLADFPLPPGGGGGGGGGGEDDETEGGGSRREPPGASTYPIRQMMELIESIAAKQTEITELDWKLWCLRLEQTLVQAKDCAVVKAFQRFGLNPLSPLRHEAFRPAFAETDASPEGQLYERTLALVEKAWVVDHCKALGAQS